MDREPRSEDSSLYARVLQRLSSALQEAERGTTGESATLEADVERAARAELDRNEMVQVQARLQERPLSRTLILSGPADDFQRSELVRAGIAVLSALDNVQLTAAMARVESIKTGRPKK